MTVRLRRDRRGAGAGDGMRISGIDPSELARVFATVGERWRAIAAALNDDPSAVLAHTPSAAPNNSDFGIMLAWTTLVEAAVQDQSEVEIACADPWLFRHFAALPGIVCTTPAPRLWPQALALWARGQAARLRFAWRTWRRAGRCRKPAVAPGAAALLAYVHPASTVQGDDAYFGPLLRRIPGLYRVLHVDSAGNVPPDPGLGPSLSAWGSPLHALLRLPFARWTPSARHRAGPWGWLVRRAAAREGGTAQAAAIAWQIHCQTRWLHQCRPRVVAWPWENHGWERALARSARALGVRTIGHQHSVIGEQFNIGCVDPDALPDLIAANGPSGRDQMLDRAIPPERVAVAGTLRFSPQGGPRHDPDGPVFLAVPFDRRVAAQMIEALRPLAERGVPVWMRDHPLFPVDFTPSPGMARAPGPLPSLDRVRAVVYAATTVGLEAILAGLPTVRFVPSGCVSVDILPKSLPVPAADSARLAATILAAGPPRPVRWEEIFSPPDLDFWRGQLT